MATGNGAPEWLERLKQAIAEESHAAKVDLSRAVGWIEGRLSRRQPEKRVATPIEAEWEETFEEVFWPRYPRKTGKQAALRAWMRIEPKTQQTLDEVWQGLERHRPAFLARDAEHRPHAATYLNQRRWLEMEP